MGSMEHAGGACREPFGGDDDLKGRPPDVLKDLRRSADNPWVTIEHDLIDDVARLRVMGDFVARRDIDLLTAIVADYVRDAECSSIEIDLALLFKITQPALAAFGAIKDMASSHHKALRIVGAHSKVREELQEKVCSRQARAGPVHDAERHDVQGSSRRRLEGRSERISGNLPAACPDLCG